MFQMRPTVLCIDDDPYILTLCSRYLEASGYCVITAQDGETGLRMLAREHPDALVTDIEMPGMNGLEVIKHAARIAPDIPSIVCSARDDMEHTVLSLHRGAWAFVPKQSPFLADLDATLAKTLRRARRTRLERLKKNLKAEPPAAHMVS